MMGIIMPETCWAVSVRQSNKIVGLIVASNWVFYLSFFLRVWGFRSNVAAYFFSLSHDAQSRDELIKTFTDEAMASSSRVGRDVVVFNVNGAVHRKYIPIYIQQDATLHSLFISGNCSTCFGWYHHPSSGAQTTVFTASGICHTVIATCRDSGRYQ